MKVYVVLFHWENDYELEGVFETKEDAKNYIFNQALGRGLSIPSEIWIEEVELQKNQTRIDTKNAEEHLVDWGCEDKEEQKVYLERITAEIEAL